MYGISTKNLKRATEISAEIDMIDQFIDSIKRGKVEGSECRIDFNVQFAISDSLNVCTDLFTRLLMAQRETYRMDLEKMGILYEVDS